MSSNISGGWKRAGNSSGGGRSSRSGGRGGGGSDRGRGVHRGRGGGRGSGRGGRGGGGYQGRGESTGYQGRGGRGGSGIEQRPRQALTNIILAETTPNFKFYIYGVNCCTKEGKQIDSRSRRLTLFNLGLFDRNVGFLSRDSRISEKDIRDICRVVFFEGSFFYSARIIPGLEADKLPLSIVGGGKKKETAENIPTTEFCESVEITFVRSYRAPLSVQTTAVATATTATPASSGGDQELSMDLRCSNCTSSFTSLSGLMRHCQMTGHSPEYLESTETHRPANQEEYLAYCNIALRRAMKERMAQWGREYVHPSTFTIPKDRSGKELSVKVFRAYSCEFGLNKIDVNGDKLTLALTVDLRAKVLRTKSLLHQLYNGQPNMQRQFSKQEQEKARRHWIGEVVIATYDKKCYVVTQLIFDKSPADLPVKGLNMNHAQYFEQRKFIKLAFPHKKPIVEVLGRNDSKIYLPAELVCGNELEPNLKRQLPSITSFLPSQRNEAIDEIKRFLVPRAQKTRGVGGDFLPSLGIHLKEERMKVPATVLALPIIIAAGVRVPENKGGMWAPMLTNAKFRVEGKVLNLNVVLVYHETIEKSQVQVYNKIRDMVNSFKATYRFSQKPYALVKTGDLQRHWGEVEKFFGVGKDLPSNIFVVDLSRPPRGSSSDPAYSVVKQILGKHGYLSQFVNFHTCDHSSPRDGKKSSTILQGVSRQILSKCGVRLWWVKVPPSIPTPCIIVGIDVFHAPRRYDSQQGKKTAKESVAAVIVQVIRSHERKDHMEIYSETARRPAGKEIELGGLINQVLSNAMKLLKVDPMSCFIFRDGVSNNMVNQVAEDEVPAARRALAGNTMVRNRKSSKVNAKQQTPLAYIVCQKRINTKFTSIDQKSALPCGTYIQDLQGPEHVTFYINGTSPPYSTPKPVRFIIKEKDQALASVPISDLAYALCHDYPNWCGPIKVPAPVKMADRLAELAGGFPDRGDSLNAIKFVNKVYFL